MGKGLRENVKKSLPDKVEFSQLYSLLCPNGRLALILCDPEHERTHYDAIHTRTTCLCPVVHVHRVTDQSTRTTARSECAKRQFAAHINELLGGCEQFDMDGIGFG